MSAEAMLLSHPGVSVQIPRMPRPRPGAALTLKNLAEHARIPVNAYVHLTSRCNLPCEHCYQVRDGSNGGRQVGYGDDLSTERLVAVLEELADLGCMFLTLTGGEALLRPDFDDIIRYARRLGFVTKLFTNGVLVDEAMADRIAACGPHEVHISVYGVTAEAHETVTRAPGSFERTRRAVELLIARGLEVVIKMVVMTVNWHEWRQVKEWAEGLGCKISLDPTVTPREDGDLSPTRWRISDEQMQELYAAIGREQIDSSSAPWRDWMEQPESAQQEFLDHGTCGACSTTLAVVGDGSVQSCQLMHVSAGNVKQRGITEIWEKSAWFQKVRSITLRSMRECRTCPDLAFCDRCSALALHEDGDAFGPSAEKCRQAAIRRAVWEEDQAGAAVGSESATQISSSTFPGERNDR